MQLSIDFVSAGSRIPNFGLHTFFINKSFSKPCFGLSASASTRIRMSFAPDECRPTGHILRSHARKIHHAPREFAPTRPTPAPSELAPAALDLAWPASSPDSPFYASWTESHPSFTVSASAVSRIWIDLSPYPSPLNPQLSRHRIRPPLAHTSDDDLALPNGDLAAPDDDLAGVGKDNAVLRPRKPRRSQIDEFFVRVYELDVRTCELDVYVRAQTRRSTYRIIEIA